MQSGENILSIDCGTQSLRAMIFDSNGKLIQKAKVEYEAYTSPKEGWAEQDAELYWRSLCHATKELKISAYRAFKEIGAVVLTAQRDCHICVDENGKPLRPMISWLDVRKAPIVYRPRGPKKWVYSAVGMWEVFQKAQQDGKMNWIKKFEPEIWEKTHKFLNIAAFLNFRLTGEFRDSLASQVGHVPFDYKKRRWGAPHYSKSLLFPVEPEKLIDLVEPGEVLGQITSAASKQSGLREGLPVIAAGTDKACEALGMGTMNTETASLSFGTQATVQTFTEKYYEPEPFFPSFCAPIPGLYNPEIEIYRGYWMIKWFKEEIGFEEVFRAKKMNVEPELILNGLLEKAPAGCQGLMLLPYWGPGLSNPSAKGAIIGFGGVHKKEHIYRATIEGLSFSLLHGLQALERRGHFKVKQAAVSGGASQSDEICQISADIFNLPLVRGETYETSGLGAAIIAAVGSGLYSNFDSAVQGMVRYGRTFHPNPKNVSLYRELYHKVYRKMDSVLAPLHDKIRDIVNYPEKINSSG